MRYSGARMYRIKADVYVGLAPYGRWEFQAPSPFIFMENFLILIL